MEETETKTAFCPVCGLEREVPADSSAVCTDSNRHAPVVMVDVEE